MASTLLAEDKPVLLIDANFRRPSTSRLFPHAQADGAPADFSDYGLSNYLMGQCASESQIIRPSGIENLFVIDSGPAAGQSHRTVYDRADEKSARTL